MAYKPTLADAQEAISSSGYTPNLSDAQEAVNGAPSIESSLGQIFDPRVIHAFGAIKNNLGRSQALVGGAAQGAASTGASVANIPSELYNAATQGHAPTISKPDLSRFYDAAAYPGAAGIGELVGSSAIPGGIYTKGLKYIPEMKGVLKYAPSMIAGGTAGAATGENAPGGRLLGGMVGSSIAPIGQAGADIAKIGGLSSTNLANRILQRSKEAQKFYTAQYGKILSPNVVAKAGDVKAPFINKNLFDKLTSDQKKTVNNFYNDNNLINAHKAQSEIGKYQANLMAKPKLNRSDIENTNIGLAKQARKQIQDNIKAALKNAGMPEIGNLYDATSAGYAKDVIPYRASTAIEDYKKGDIKASTMLRKLSGASRQAEKFDIKVGDKNPEVDYFNAIKNIKKSILPAAFITNSWHHLKELL